MNEAQRIQFFTRAHGAYAPWLRSLVSRMVPGDESSDVLQNVWMAVLRHAHTFDPERGTMGAWLAAIARHEVLTYVRRRRRSADHVALSDSLPSARDRARAEEAEQLHSVMRALSPREAELLNLYARGIGSRAVATAHDEPRAAARRRLERTLHKARAMLPEPSPP